MHLRTIRAYLLPCDLVRVGRILQAGSSLATGMVVEDEAFFVHYTVSGCKYWSLRERWIAAPHMESHKRVSVYGTITKDGRQFFRTCDRFNTPTLIKYLKSMQKHFGRAAVVMDRPILLQGSVDPGAAPFSSAWLA